MGEVVALPVVRVDRPEGDPRHALFEIFGTRASLREIDALLIELAKRGFWVRPIGEDGSGDGDQVG